MNMPMRSAHKHRLDRDLTGRFGSFAYAMDEAVAELTASFILADLGLAYEPRPDHAAYLASWMEVLQIRPARHLHRRLQGATGRRLDACTADERFNLQR